MLNIPILRWGQKPYTSLEQDHVIHFLTGETLARVSQANTGLLGRDIRQCAARTGHAHGDSDRRIDRNDEEGGRLLSQRPLPMGRW